MPRFLTDREIAYIHAAELARKPVPMSEALGNQQGKTLKLLQYDRMRTDPFDESQRGGPWFSWLQKVQPEYENVAAAFTKKSGAKAKAKESGEDVVWAPFLGAREQHKSNTPMFNKFMDEFEQQLALGNISPELLALINKRIPNMPSCRAKRPSPLTRIVNTTLPTRSSVSWSTPTTVAVRSPRCYAVKAWAAQLRGARLTLRSYLPSTSSRQRPMWTTGQSVTGWCSSIRTSATDPTCIKPTPT
jgi:hypothetical protein